MASPSGTTLSISITPEAVLVLQVACDDQGPRVIARGLAETPSGAVSSSSIDHPTAVGATLRTLLRQMGIRDKSATLVMPSGAYSVRSLRLPELPVRERRAVVRGELEQTGAIPFGSGAFDFLWLGAPTGGSSIQVEAFTYFSSAAVVDSLLTCCRDAGLRLESLEPASIAAMRAYLACGGAGEPVALVASAAKHTDICIHDGRQVRHLRRINSGWLDLYRDAGAPSSQSVPNQEPAPYLGDPDAPTEWPPREEPELRVATWGEEGEEIQSAASEAAPVTTGVRARRRSTPREVVMREEEHPFLASEVARTLAFFAREHEDAARPLRLVVLGPSRGAESVAQVLQAAISIPVSVETACGGLELPQAAPNAAIAGDTGLEWAALVGSGCGSQRREYGLGAVDLADEAAVRRGRVPGDRRLVFGGLAGASLWLAASLVAAVACYALETGTANQLAQVQSKIERIEETRAPALRAQELAGAVAAARKAAEIPAGAVLGRVAASAGSGIALQSLSITPDGQVSLGGQASGPFYIQRFALDLGQGESLRKPFIETLKQDDKGQFTFRIGARFREQAPAVTADAKSEQKGGE